MLMPRARISAGSGAAGGLDWLVFMLKPQPVSPEADVPPVLELGRVALEVVLEGLLEVVPRGVLEDVLEVVPDVMVGLETITLGAGGGGFGRANNRPLFGFGALVLWGVKAVGLPEGVVAGFVSDFGVLLVFEALGVGLLESDFEPDLRESGLIWADALEAGCSAMGFLAALTLGMDGEDCTSGATVTTTVSAGRAGTRT